MITCTANIGDTLLIICSEVDVLCVLFWTQSVCMFQTQATRNIYNEWMISGVDVLIENLILTICTLPFRGLLRPLKSQQITANCLFLRRSRTRNDLGMNACNQICINTINSADWLLVRLATTCTVRHATRLSFHVFVYRVIHLVSSTNLPLTWILDV